MGAEAAVAPAGEGAPAGEEAPAGPFTDAPLFWVAQREREREVRDSN